MSGERIETRLAVLGARRMHDADVRRFRALYDTKADYVNRRDSSSLEARQLLLEVQYFKIPNLLAVLPEGFIYQSVAEIGCGTGELIASFPACAASTSPLVREGFDISPLNIEAAAKRYPNVKFTAEPMNGGEPVDLLILSDILEHVPNDGEFLADAAAKARIVLLNIPLEDNWLNRNRRYGADDPSGHLRRYSIEDAMSLISGSGLTVLFWRRVWSHESPFESRRLALRKSLLGAASSGSLPVRLAKAATRSTARTLPSIGHWLFPSNLFVSASVRS